MKQAVQRYPSAGFFRRLGAWFYDALSIITIELLASGLLVIVLQGFSAIGLISLEGYQDYADYLSRHPFMSPFYTAYSVIIWVGFFVYFWKKGQTLGMKAWRLLITDEEGRTITVTQALIRLSTSAFGLSNLTVAIDPKRRGFQDIWAKTQIVVIDKG